VQREIVTTVVERSAPAIARVATARRVVPQRVPLISDSGASHSIHAGDASELTDVRRLDQPREIHGISADAEPIVVTEHGTRHYPGGYSEDVYICPEATLSLSSISQAVASGEVIVVFSRGGTMYLKRRSAATLDAERRFFESTYDTVATFGLDNDDRLFVAESHERMPVANNATATVATASAAAAAPAPASAPAAAVSVDAVSRTAVIPPEAKRRRPGESFSEWKARLRWQRKNGKVAGGGESN
jgi:hypothetical protein